MSGRRSKRDPPNGIGVRIFDILRATLLAALLAGPGAPTGPVYSHTYTKVGNGDLVFNVTDAALVTSGTGESLPDTRFALDPTGNDGEQSFFMHADGNSSYVEMGADLGNQWIALSNLIFAPEPNTFTLVGLGLAGLAAIQRRR